MSVKYSRASTVRSIRMGILLTAYFAFLAVTLGSSGDVIMKDPLQLTEKKVVDDGRKQTKRVYTLVDHSVRICMYAFLSAVFAGLTLGVMCANTFTLEIIAESGPSPDCNYAATLLPLRKQGHKTLATLIISNMLCNVLIVQEFSDAFDVVEAIRTRGAITHVVDDSGSGIWKFIGSTLVIVLFAEILPMSICRSKYSLRVAAAGSVFVNVAMILTYPLSATLGWLLDILVGSEETGQLYDKKELRKLMVMHYERKGEDNAHMAKSELKLLLAAMDFHERKVRDIMTPIEKTTYVRCTDLITPDFLEMLWKSGRSRVPVESAPGVFESILVVKDLMTITTSLEFTPLTVEQVVKAKDRLFAMVCAATSLPSMLKFFLEGQTHMAVVFEEDTNSSGAASPAIMSDFETGGMESLVRRNFPSTRPKIVGIVTMEDVVEELLASEIYDEYDRYDPMEREPRYAAVNIPGNDRYSNTLHLPNEPETPPRVNFYSYFTHPTESIPLTESQVWAVAYYLNRTVPCFYNWQPPYIKLLLDECKDLQLCAVTPGQLNDTSDMLLSTPPDERHEIINTTGLQTAGVQLRLPRSQFFKDGHTEFLSAARDPSYILYTSGIRTERLLLVLGGSVELLVGPEAFRTKLQSFNYIGEEALTTPFFVPDYSAIVTTAARVYSIPKVLFDKYHYYQYANYRRSSEVRVLSPTFPGLVRASVSRQGLNTMASSERESLLGHRMDGEDTLKRQYGTTNKKTF